MTERDAFGDLIEPGAGPAAALPPTPASAASAPATPLAPAASAPPRRARAAAGRTTEGSGLGWFALIVAVGGFFVVPVLSSIAAIVIARRARQKLAADGRTGPVTAALVLGWGGLAFWVLGLAFFVVFGLTSPS